MDLNKVLAELLRERDLIDQAIANLERLSSGMLGVPERRPSRANPPKPERVRTAGQSFD